MLLLASSEHVADRTTTRQPPLRPPPLEPLGFAEGKGGCAAGPAVKVGPLARAWRRAPDGAPLTAPGRFADRQRRSAGADMPRHGPHDHDRPPRLAYHGFSYAAHEAGAIAR